MNKVNKITLSLLPLLCSHVAYAVTQTEQATYALDRSALAIEHISQTINFNAQVPLSFGANDNNKTGKVSVSPDGKSLSLGMNRWQYIEGDFRITAGTVLEFDVLMNTTGEIQGIGFENDLEPTSTSAFKLAGSQNWGISGYKYTELGVVKTIQINVGQHFTGDFNKLVFISDNDNGSSGDITFSNVTLREENTAGAFVYQVAELESWNTLALALYGSMDVAPHLRYLLQDKYPLTPANRIPFSDLPDTLTTGVLPKPVDSDQDGLKDHWERLYFGDLTPTADEDTDLDGLTNAQEQLEGTDPHIVNSQLNLDALSRYGAQQVDFFQHPLLPHDNQDDATTGSLNVLDNGKGLHLVGNRWIALPLNYLVTENTQVQFDLDISVEGEIHGIGFDNDMSVSSNSVFTVAGTQNWGISGAAKKDPNKPNRYTIDVGQYLQGQFQYLLVVADDDVNKRSDSIISNLTIIEKDSQGEPYYQVQNDDTWESIADRLYNNPGLASLLQEGFGAQFLLAQLPKIPASHLPEKLAQQGPEWSQDWDNDGLPNSWEMKYHTNPVHPFDAQQDDDNDGLSNLAEFKRGSHPHHADSDFDGVDDADDFAPQNPRYRLDQDQDGLPDAWEQEFGLDPSKPEDALLDIDDDRLTNLQEFVLQSSPINPDSDFDSVLDGEDFSPVNRLYRQDSAMNGTPDYWEDQYLRFDVINPVGPDQDQLSLLAEFIAGTSPVNVDTDADGMDDAADAYPLDPRYAYDSDQDGLPDAWELAQHLNPVYYHDAHVDSDHDGLTNISEFKLGTSPRDSDSDFDGAEDYIDFAPLNPNFTRDEDFDGMPREWEERYGLSDYAFQDAFFDFDYDGLSNQQEFLLGTSPLLPDSDSDGVMDSEDVAPLNPTYTKDVDRDGIPYEWERRFGFNDNSEHDAVGDEDGDNLINLQEFLLGTHPRKADSDNDGITDGEDFAPLNPEYRLDNDNDGLPERWELRYGFYDNDSNDSRLDADNDSLTNLQEYQLGTDPRAADSDNDGIYDADDFAPLNPLYRQDSDKDGMPDSWEMAYGLSYFDGSDSQRDEDGDGLTNLQEFKRGTHPREADFH